MMGSNIREYHIDITYHTGNIAGEETLYIKNLDVTIKHDVMGPRDVIGSMTNR